MPQLFQVLKCYKCSVFQVHETKKSNKWECKLCGEKQSIKRHYGLGTGKECRLHVQKLNGIRGKIDELNESLEINKSSEEELGQGIDQEISTNKLPSNSKWSNFIQQTEPVPESDTNEGMFFENTEVVLEVPVKKRRRFKAPKIHSPPAQSENTNIANLKEPELEETTMFFCKPDFTAYNNAFSNINSSIINSTMSNSEISWKKNKPQMVINKLNNLNNKETDNSTHNSNSKNVYVSPKPNENSKWTRFAEESDANENDDPKRKDPPVASNLFTLCDENELDDVLDF